MARADRRRAEREARHVQRRPRASGGGARIAEQTMFFPKLRRQAKWVFVLLALVFALGEAVKGTDKMLRRLIGPEIDFEVTVTDPTAIATLDPGRAPRPQALANQCYLAHHRAPR